MADNCAVLDTLVQGSAVELFHSFGIAVAPAIPTFHDQQILAPHGQSDLSGSIAFVGRFSGTLVLSVPEAVFSLLKQDPQRPYVGRDWVREAVNQLMGRLKSRLLQFQISIQCGLPSTASRDAIVRLRQGSPLFLIYSFRTLRGNAVVALGGEIDRSLLAYSSATAVPPNEGDIILF